MLNALCPSYLLATNKCFSIQEDNHTHLSNRNLYVPTMYAFWRAQIVRMTVMLTSRMIPLRKYIRVLTRD